MKKLSFLFIAAFAFLGSWAQDSSEVVRWDFSAVKGGVLILKGTVKPGWRLYSTTMKDDLPNSRVVLDTASVAAGLRILGIDEKGKAVVMKEPLFDNAATRSFENELELDVKLAVGTGNPGTNGSTGAGSGALAGAGKDAKEGGSGASAGAGKDGKVGGSGALAGTGKDGMEGGSGALGGAVKDVKGVVTYMAILKDSVVGPIEVPFRYSVGADGALVAKSTKLIESAGASNELKKPTIDLDKPVNGCGGTGAEGKKSLWGIFLLGVLGGLVGLIMPCTFPMIPLTVSFFTKRAPTRKAGIRNAFMYGAFIFLIYVLISAPFYFISSSDSGFLNNLATNVWLNLAYAAIFIVFALSFFGLFEITLPSKFSNSVDEKSNMSSVGGIFFMALTLVIVSFSCTGPLLGSLIIGSFSGGALPLTVALAGFGLALGLPFALFALFPGWLQTLPRSGAWMNTVKIVFAFIELAFALKYLSNADLVSHWGLLKREVFFALWILIALGVSLFLLGILKFKHDPPPAKLGKGRLVAGLLFLALVIYLIPGLTNTKSANRALVSGFPPPLSYSLYSSNDKEVEPLVINDYNKALAMAKEQHKPLLIDFTGWACVNCRKMEENVWPKDVVKDIIKNNYILVSLYVDDKKVLPEDQQFLFTAKDGSKKKIVTVGDKFMTLQAENFRNASQPLYALVSPDEQLLTLPVGYTPDAKEYSQWLQCGLDAFNKK